MWVYALVLSRATVVINTINLMFFRALGRDVHNAIMTMDHKTSHTGQF